ncbi:MAG: sulfatase-like hydrolase/transferase [Bacteroidales bacterium]
MSIVEKKAKSGVCMIGIMAMTTIYAQEIPKKYNILLIQSDQHRYDCMSSTGNRANTPNLDHISKEGVFFNNAFSPIPTSCPARQTLLTGLWPEKHGGLWNWDITFRAPEFKGETWTERLSDAGFKLGYVGKWHVHPQKTPVDYGFDDYVQEWGPYEKFRKDNNMPEVYRAGDGPFFGGYDPVAKEDAKTHWMSNQAIELIKKYESEGHNWHVRLDLAEPHLPCFPAKEFYDKYDPDKLVPWGNVTDSFVNKPYIQHQQLFNWGIEDFTWDDWKKYVHRYLATIEQVDDAIGHVFNELSNMGILDNTIIIYTSDHGDAAGSHGMLDKHYIMYDEVVRVPLVIYCKDLTKRGLQIDQFVLNGLDIAATISDINKLGLITQGASLYPLLKGEKVDSWRKYAFSNYNGQQFGLYVQRMIRNNHLKYVWNMTDIDELYDLKNDPNELLNIIDNPQYKEHLVKLRQELYADLQRRGDPVIWQNATKKQLIESRKLSNRRIK